MSRRPLSPFLAAFALFIGIAVTPSAEAKTPKKAAKPAATKKAARDDRKAARAPKGV